MYSLYWYGGQKCANEEADFAAIIRSGSAESGDSSAFRECSSVRSIQVPDTVNSLLATTSRKRPPPVSNHFVNNRFAFQSNIAYIGGGFDVSARASKRRISRNSRSRAPGKNKYCFKNSLVSDHCSKFLSDRDRDRFLGPAISHILLLSVSGKRPPKIIVRKSLLRCQKSYTTDILLCIHYKTRKTCGRNQ